MPATPTAAHEAPVTRAPQHDSAAHSPAPPPDPRDAHTRRHQPARPAHPPTDDEILGLPHREAGLDTAPARSSDPAQSTFDFDATPTDVSDSPSDVIPPALRNEGSEARNLSSDSAQSAAEPANFRGIFEANPELRRAWQDAQAYRETFATPEAARAATAQLADLDRMDTLFFSRRPEDHAELARVVASLDPHAFASLAQAMSAMFASPSLRPAANTGRDVSHPPTSSGSAGVPPANFLGSTENQNRQLEAGATGAAAPTGRHPERSVPSSPLREAPGHAAEGSLFDAADSSAPATPPAPTRTAPSAPTPAQTEFFHAANAAAVEGVLDAIESQVERLLPESVSKSARNRVVGEIYRELDTTLRSNRQLGQQMRDAFRLALSEANVSGAPLADHQRAIVSLVTGRARQALPAVAKRVLNEWTSTVVAANNDRRARQHAAERRIDISGASGAANTGRSASPRSIDYARMSDSDILNL